MPSLGVSPRARPILRNWVEKAIRDAIVEGVLQPGELLHERSLATRLEVSRQTLREALNGLAFTGLVEMRRNRTARVADLRDVAGQDASITLGLLMRGVVSQSIPRFDDSTVSKARDVVSGAIDAVRDGGAEQLDTVAVEGYHAWAGFSANRVLGELLGERADGLALRLRSSSRADAGLPPDVVLTALSSLGRALAGLDTERASRAITWMHAGHGTRP